MPNACVLLYLPVIQKSYIDLLKRYNKYDVYIYDESVLKEFPYLRKDIRALRPREATEILKAYNLVQGKVSLISRKEINQVFKDYHKIIMPDDDISHVIAGENFKKAKFLPIFLRWDRKNSTINTDVTPDRTIESNDKERIIDLIYKEANSSSDWWRRVGAALAKNNNIIGSAHNQHLPTAYSPIIDNDPRSNASKGVAIEASTAKHAEATLIANAARNGTKVEGADIYVTTFPCPNCAKMIAEAGIKKCYYCEGYAMTDGLSVMKQAGIEIIKINAPSPGKGSEYVPYPDKD